MTIIGIDIGITQMAPCGLAVYEPYGQQVLDVATIKPTNKSDDVDVRISDIGSRIDLYISYWQSRDGDVRAVAYELPYFADNAQTALKLARMCGAVVMIAALRGLPVYGIQPVAAKVALCGFPVATKDDMITSAERQFGRDNLTSHEADAIGIAIAGWAKYKADHMERVAT